MNVIILLEYQGANSNALMFMNAIFLVTEEDFFFVKTLCYHANKCGLRRIYKGQSLRLRIKGL